jgi:hypothetical protein
MTGESPNKAVSPIGGNGTGSTTDPKSAAENGGTGAKSGPPEPTGGDGSPGNEPQQTPKSQQ